jgi:hypothetical protein
MSLAMTREEREAFLADVHVGVVSIADPERGPLTVPIWYAYEPGGEEKAQRMSLCAQSEAPPYKYASVEGPIVSIEPSDVERDVRPLAHRYLGEEFGDRYVEATSDTRDGGENVLVRMRPERWLTVDYAKQFGDAP